MTFIVLTQALTLVYLRFWLGLRNCCITDSVLTKGDLYSTYPSLNFSLFKVLAWVAQLLYRGLYPNQGGGYEPNPSFLIYLYFNHSQGGGGLAMYYAEYLAVQPYHPTVSPQQAYLDNERQWLLIDAPGSKVALLNVYLSCVRANNDHIGWNTELLDLLIHEGRHLRSLGFTILALGIALIVFD